MAREPEISVYTGFMPRRPNKEATEFGKRLSELRKAAGLSQSAVAEALGIPQRRVSFYEREARCLPSNLVQPLADLLGVPVSEFLGGNPDQAARRGPKSRLERLFEKAQELPRTKQELITKLLVEIIGSPG